MVSEITRVGIVGCGLMGSGLAETCARSGTDVVAVVTSEHSINAGQERIERSLDRAQQKGKLDERERKVLLDRISITTDIATLADRQLVIEAVTEHAPTKLEVFSQLDAVVDDPDAILATNTSSLAIMKIANATRRPGKVVGTHFFNPVPVLPLVELVPSLLTEPRTIERIEGFVSGTLGKQTVLSSDRSGFVVNALLVPYLLSAMRMVESGFASAEDIDRAMALGCAHPMGPLELADLLGLDTLFAVANGLYEEHKEPLFSPPPLLCRMVEGGLHGRKAGRGFYTYR